MSRTASEMVTRSKLKVCDTLPLVKESARRRFKWPIGMMVSLKHYADYPAHGRQDKTSASNVSWTLIKQLGRSTRSTPEATNQLLPRSQLVEKDKSTASRFKSKETSRFKSKETFGECQYPCFEQIPYHVKYDSVRRNIIRVKDWYTMSF